MARTTLGRDQRHRRRGRPGPPSGNGPSGRRAGCARRWRAASPPSLGGSRPAPGPRCAHRWRRSGPLAEARASARWPPRGSWRQPPGSRRLSRRRSPAPGRRSSALRWWPRRRLSQRRPARLRRRAGLILRPLDDAGGLLLGRLDAVLGGPLAFGDPLADPLLGLGRIRSAVSSAAATIEATWSAAPEERRWVFVSHTRIVEATRRRSRKNTHRGSAPSSSQVTSSSP